VWPALAVSTPPLAPPPVFTHPRRVHREHMLQDPTAVLHALRVRMLVFLDLRVAVRVQRARIVALLCVFTPMIVVDLVEITKTMRIKS